MRTALLAVSALLVALALLAALLPARPALAAVSPRPAACTPLTLREQSAQTVLTGVPGTAPSAAARDLAARHAGAVLLMGRNVTDAAGVRALTDDLRAAARLPLPVAVDEEGGRVSRLSPTGIVTALPPARLLPDGHTPEGVRALGRRLGEELRAVGVDWDLAPVLDVTAAPPGTVIGDRSFGPDPGVVGRYGGAFAQGLRDAGVHVAGKHFPGHGRTAVDSHERLPTVDATVDELLASDVLPYALAGDHLDAVLTAHVRFPALDPDRPASLSPAATALLREHLGYDGLLVTDALEMGAVAARWDPPTAAELAIAAGADMVTVADAFAVTPVVTDRVADAVATGRIPAVRLQEAVRRVLAFKGLAPAESTCLLGLPPVTDALAVVGDDGQVYAVLDGKRRAVPDDETLRAAGLDAHLGRYASSEVDALPLGDPLPTARRVEVVPLHPAAPDAAAFALALSRERFADGAAQRVVLGRADDPADALGGTALAGTDAPLLLLDPGAAAAARAAVAAEVARVLAPGGRLDVLGGEAALSTAALGDLAADSRLRRLGGGDRYATAALVAEEVRRDRGAAGPAATVLLARGDRAADAVAAGPLAAARGLPVLLTRPDDLPDVTRAALTGVERTVVIGGQEAVADAVVAGLPGVQRWSGANRAATAVAVARQGWGRAGGRPGDVFVLTGGADGAGEDGVDDTAVGLAVAGRAAAAGAPLLLSGPSLALDTAGYLAGLGYPGGATARVEVAGTPVPEGLRAVGISD